MDDPALDAFEAHRDHLLGLAYRMLGSIAEAEDVVQEAFLRWHEADPRAYLARVVTRLGLDHLKSARVRREHYVGPWLPEPVVDADALSAGTASEYADDVTVALERAAFLLHDVFDLDFAEVALRDADGIVQTMALEIRDGATDIVRNPVKLGHL
jgi:RNA polymerase sigma-70 factor (ECF subfamily)